MKRHPILLPRRRFLGQAVAASGLLAPCYLLPTWARAQGAPPASDQEKIEAAVPSKAWARPTRARTLLIFTLNVNYGGHPSIATANQAFKLMGRKTGAFETVVSRDPAVFQQESLSRFDAVFFNNTVGNLFEDAGLRQNLVEFVYGGGGLMGVHGTSVAFTRWPGAAEDWPEFGILLGARGANHRASDEHVFIKLDDPAHPVNQAFGGQGFDYRDEFFRVHEPYSRQRVRVLLSIDTAKTDLRQGPAYGRLERDDNDFALAWVRQYGRGRVFYCTIAHNPRVFWDPKMLQFYLAAAQFVSGDLAGPTTPSARITPARRAQEQLGWRLGLAAPEPAVLTLFDTIDTAAEAGLLHVSASNLQEVSPDLRKRFDPVLSPDEMRQVRLKLDTAGVRLLTWRIQSLPAEEAGWRRTFEFARRMGVEVLLVPPLPTAMPLLDRLCREHGISLALQSGDTQVSTAGRRLDEMLNLCQERSQRVGVLGEPGLWALAGMRPAEVIRRVGGRLTGLLATDLDGVAGKAGELLRTMRVLRVKPAFFAVEQFPSAVDSKQRLAAKVASFERAALQLAEEERR